VQFKSKNPKTCYNYFLDPKPVLSEFATPGVLQPTPLKKNLVLRFGARIRKGENTIHFLAEITIGDYTTSKLKHSGI
jgi:hypothetical protein